MISKTTSRLLGPNVSELQNTVSQILCKPSIRKSDYAEIVALIQKNENDANWLQISHVVHSTIMVIFSECGYFVDLLEQAILAPRETTIPRYLWLTGEKTAGCVLGLFWSLGELHSLHETPENLPPKMFIERLIGSIILAHRAPALSAAMSFLDAEVIYPTGAQTVRKTANERQALFNEAIKCAVRGSPKIPRANFECHSAKRILFHVNDRLSQETHNVRVRTHAFGCDKNSFPLSFGKHIATQIAIACFIEQSTTEQVAMFGLYRDRMEREAK